MPLQPGQEAPDFSVTSSDGRVLALAALRGKKNVVLYFYPADFTSVCTREACGFRDLHAELGGKDTEVIGVSFDGDDSHRRFAKEHGVSFPLVSDSDKVLARAYGVFGGLRGLLGRVQRVTYVIDKQGRIAGVLQSELSASKHVEGARKILSQLA